MGGEGGMQLIMLLLILGVFYFFMIRPQMKKQKELKKFRESLAVGDKVVTIGGIHGVISSVKEKSVIVKVDDDAKIEFNRSAISTVLKSDAEIAKEAEEKAAKEAEKKAKKAKKSEEVVETSEEENKDSE